MSNRIVIYIANNWNRAILLRSSVNGYWTSKESKAIEYSVLMWKWC